MNLENILENLEFIGNIPKNTKPCFVDKRVIHTSELFVTFRRRWNGENGENGVICVNKLLDSCDKYYRMCSLNIDGVEECERLKISLIKNIKGLQNLIYTYKIDNQKKVAEEYNKCLNRVTQLIKDIENKLKNKGFFDYYPTIISYSNKNLKAKQKFHSTF